MADSRPTRRAPARAFYTPARDIVAYLMSAVVCAVLVAYVSMLAAWAAAGAGA